MSNKACKVKICGCSVVFEGEKLGKNYEAFQSVLNTLQPTEQRLTECGIDEVIELADKANTLMQKLNNALVKLGVELSS